MNLSKRALKINIKMRPKSFIHEKNLNFLKQSLIYLNFKENFYLMHRN